MSINLLDGRTVDSNQVTFDESTYRFFYRNEEITNQIRRADKLSNWRNFDPEKDNLRLSTGNANTGKLNESTASIFAQQIVTDPLSAPLDSLDNATKKIFGSFGVQMIVFAVAAGLFLWMGGLSLIKGSLKK